MRAFLRPVHLGLVHLITLGVLTQAVLAGQFISGTSDQLGTHIAVAGLLELAALVVLVVAVVHRLVGERSRLALWGSIALALTIEIQAVLGYLPGTVPTSIHVPLGVCTFAGAVALSSTIGRHLGAHRRGAPVQPSTPSPTAPSQ